MNEVGRSNQSQTLAGSPNPGEPEAIEPTMIRERAGLVRVESSEIGGFSRAIPQHPLIWLLQLWVTTSVVSLVLSAGLSPALRGAFMAAGPWIIKVDHAAALTSQVAAICTAVLLVYMGLMSARSSRSLGIGMGAALLGTVPLFMVFFAHRFAMPEAFGWAAALCASLALLLSATQVRNRTSLRLVMGLGGLQLLSATLARGGLEGQWDPLVAVVCSFFALALSSATLLVAMGSHFWLYKQRPWRASLLLGAATLLARTVPSAGTVGARDWVLVTGRTLDELSPSGAFGSMGPFAISCALLLVVWTLVARPNSVAQAICALTALATLAPLTPLVVAWLTLCGFTAVVISAEFQDEGALSD